MTIDDGTVMCDAESCSASTPIPAEQVNRRRQRMGEEILMTSGWGNGWSNVIDIKQFCPNHSRLHPS
jgi:hypothetical protein